MFSAFSKKKSLQPPQEPVFKPEDFTCQTCDTPFDDHSKIPRRMPQCTHNYCEACLGAVLTASQSGLTSQPSQTQYFFNKNGQVICPEDERLLPAHITKVGEFPKNFKLIKAITDRNKGQHLRTSSFNTFMKSKSSVSISNTSTAGPTGATGLKKSENHKFQPKSKLQVHPSLASNQFKNHRNSTGLRPPSRPGTFSKGNLYEHSYNQSPTHSQSKAFNMSTKVLQPQEDKQAIEVIDSDPVSEETRQALADRKAFSMNFGASIIDHIKDSSMKKTIETRFQTSTGQDWQIQRLHEFKNKNWKTKFMTYKKEKLMAIQESVQEEYFPAPQQRTQSLSSQPFVYSSPDTRYGQQKEAWSPEVPELCSEHQKSQELICVQCRERCCHTCALFGKHKSHDVRQQRETVNEIQIRMEVLMEMYQQVDAQIEALNNPQRVQAFVDEKQSRENQLKERISTQFAHWHNQLNQLELSYHEGVHQHFKKFDATFDEEQTLVQMIEDEGIAWQKRICSILDQYSSQIEKDQEYIAYDILDNDATNEMSVEALYSTAEKWLEQVRKKMEYESFVALEPKYNQISVWFEPNFEARVQHLCKIVDESVKSANTSLQSFEKKLAKACNNLEQKKDAKVIIPGAGGAESNQSNSDNNIIVVGGGPSFANGDEDLKQVLLGVNMEETEMDLKLSKIQPSDGLEDRNQPKWQSESFKQALSQQIKEIMTQQQKETSPNSQEQELLSKIESMENEDFEEKIKSKLPTPPEAPKPKPVIEQQPLMKAVTKKESTSSVDDEFSSHLEAAQQASLRRQTTQVKKPAPKLADFFKKKEAKKVKEIVLNPEQESSQPSEEEEAKGSETEEVLPPKARTRSDFTGVKRPTGIGQGVSGIGQGLNKPKFNLAESFKEQAVLGDVDLAGKGLTDNCSIQLSQLLRKHAASGVMNLDISGNRLTDNGMMNVLKAINETQISRLVLSGNRLTEHCVPQIIGVLSHNKHLETVYMQDTQITGRVAKNKLSNSLKRIDLFL